MASLVERIAIVITGEAIGAVNAFKQVGAASEAAAEKVTLTQRATGALGSQFGGLASKLTGAASFAGIALAADKLVNSFADATGEVRKFQRVSGASAQDASALVASFHVLGVDSDAAGVALFRLSHNLDGSNEALAQLGVQVATAKDGTADLTGTLLNVADAVHKVGPGAQANAIAFAAFGRQASALLPVLLRGRDGLKELFDQAKRQGLVFDQSQLDKGKEFSLATKEAGDAVKGLSVQLGEGLAPALTDATKALTTFIESANKVASPLGGLGGVFEGVIGSAKQFLGITPIMDALHGDFGKIAGDTIGLGAGIELAHGHYRKALGNIIPILGEHKKKTKDSADATDALAGGASTAADALAKEAASVKAAADATKGYLSAFDAAAKAHDSLDKASRSVVTATRDEDRARDELNKLQRAGAVDAAAVAQAEKDVASAARASSDAQKAEAKAAQGVADAQQNVLDAEVALEKVKAGASAAAIARATIGAGKAQRDAQRAILALSDAQDKKGSLVSVGVVGAGQTASTTKDALTADLDLADALDNVTLSGLDAQDAQQKLADTLNEGKPGSESFKKAQDDLRAAQENLTTAVDNEAQARQDVIDKQQAQIEAGDALNKARIGDLDFSEKIRDAEQRVADAHQNTVDQVKAERDAVEALNLSEGALVTARIDRAKAVPPVPANVSGPALDRSTVNSTFGAGLTVVSPIHLDTREVARVTTPFTADELAKSARRNGLN